MNRLNLRVERMNRNILARDLEDELEAYFDDEGEDVVAEILEEDLGDMFAMPSYERGVVDTTPEGFAALMRDIVEHEGDIETRHRALDGAMADLLEALGYSDAVEVFWRAHKWYA